MESLADQPSPQISSTASTNSRSSAPILYAIGGVVLLIIAALLAMWQLYPIPWLSTQASNQSAPIDDESTGDSQVKYVYDEQFKTDTKIFYCAVIPYTESNCRLYVSDTSGSNQMSLGITLDYGSQRTGLLLSPDKKHVVAILEKEVTVITTDTLEKKVVARAPIGMVYGLYTGFPSFVPHGHWITNDQLELELFNEGTMEPYDDESVATPVEKRIVSISAQ